MIIGPQPPNISAPAGDDETSDNADWLSLARTAWSSSTTYVDANYRKNWENSLLSFNGRHGRDSKYSTDLYRHRSRLYRPKTRSVIRKNEAAAAIAFFSNNDVIGTEPMNPSDPKQVASAAIMKELIQYRLTKTINWFQVMMGAVQDAQTIGVVVSTQYWEYHQTKTSRNEPLLHPDGTAHRDANGEPIMQGIDQIEIKVDRPVIKIIPVE